MHLSAPFLFAASLWVANTAAQPAAAAAEKADKANTICYTAFAATKGPAKLKTSTSTSTGPCTNTFYKTLTKTVKPRTTTSTSTAIQTTTSTASTATGTATDTETDTSTSTEITTSTSTVTATETDTSDFTSTSTVPASAGFTPVQSSLPGSSYDGKGGSDPVIPNGAFKRSEDSKGHAQAVNCLVVAQAAASKCDKLTIYRTSTVTASTPTKTATVTSTSTTTITPSATTTVTTTVDTTVVTTSTATTESTTTTTVFNDASTTTVYAACASNNIVDVIGSAQIAHIFNYAQKVPGPGYDVSTTNTAYDCCVAGLLDPHPGAVFQYEIPTKRCYINYVSAGDPFSQTDQNWEISAVNNGVPLAVGNLYYGVIDKDATGSS